MRAPVPATTLGALALITAACTKPDAPPQPQPWATGVPTAVEEHARELDARDQYALLDAIVAAKGNDTFADPGTMPRVRSEWVDRRYRWEARLQPSLCGPIGECVVLPFDHNRREEPIAQGWLPRLALATEARTALVERCSEFRQCVVTFEGTLAQFELSSEVPTSLTFSDVEVTDVREARADESWTISKRRERLNQRARAALARMR